MHQRNARGRLQTKLERMDALLAAAPAPGASDNQRSFHAEEVEELARMITDDLAALMSVSTENVNLPTTTPPAYDGVIGPAMGWGRGMRVQIITTPPPGGSETGDPTGHTSWQTLKKRKADQPFRQIFICSGAFIK